VSASNVTVLTTLTATLAGSKVSGAVTNALIAATATNAIGFVAGTGATNLIVIAGTNGTVYTLAVTNGIVKLLQ
jgi:hypothetical protein